MKIINPTKHREGHVQWTHHGMAYGTFFVTSIDYGLRPPDEKDQAFDSHETLALGCPDDTVLTSLQVPMDVVDVLARSLDNVDLKRTPAYTAEALEGYKRIVEIGPLTRLNFVTFPLGKHYLTGEPDRSEVARMFGAAAEAAAAADPEGRFELHPVPEGLLPFSWNHNLMRGAAMEMAPQDPAKALVATRSNPKFLPGTLDEGARTENPFWRSFDPLIKTMVRRDDGHVIDSYQAMLTPRSFPSTMLFPGHSEILSILDGIEIDGIDNVSVDWAMRLRRVDRETAMQQNEKMLARLVVQLEERSGELGYHSREIQNKIAVLTAYNDRLATNENADEIKFTTVIGVGATKKSDLKKSVATLRARFRKLGVRVDAPRAAQAKLWHLLNPGAPDDEVYTDYQHVAASSDWAGLVPFTTARLLDDTGPVIGVNLLSGLFEPLHFNFLGRAEADKSPAIAVAGEQGSGKSYFVKTLAAIIADLLGRFLAIDKDNEYLALAGVIDGSIIVDLANPNFTLDPLQLFSDPVKARKIALDTILPMLNIPTADRRGILLSKLLRPESRGAHSLHSLADVRDYCAELGRRNIPEADKYAEIADAMDAAEAPVLFGRGLDPMPLGATATIVRTHGLQLPLPHELALAHTYANLPWSKRVGHALYELIGHLAADVFLRPDGKFGAFICDEAYHFTRSAVGKVIVEEFVRLGRRNQAGLILASHDPKDDFDGVAHNLIPNRFGFRHCDKTLATNEMEWLGADVERDKHLIKQVMHHTSPATGPRDWVEPRRRGECFIADSKGRIGRGKILGPARRDRAAAVSTTPNSNLNRLISAEGQAA